MCLIGASATDQLAQLTDQEIFSDLKYEIVVINKDRKMGVLSDGVLALIQAVVFVYDIVTFPLYTVTQRPWTVVSDYSKERSQVVDQDETSITIKAHHKMTKPLQVCLATIHFKSSQSVRRVYFSRNCWMLGSTPWPSVSSLA